MSSERPENVARPAALVVAVSVPFRVPDEMLRVTAVPGTTLPNGSAALTTTALMALPAVVLTGCVVNESVASAATEMVKGLEVALAPPSDAFKVYVPDVVTDRPVNVAIPEASVVAVFGPVKVPDERASVTVAPARGLVKKKSVRVTEPREAPALVLPGWPVKESVGSAATPPWTAPMLTRAAAV